MPFIPDPTRVSISATNSVSNTSTTITITNVTRYDRGSYFCQVRNDVGGSQWYQVLLVVQSKLNGFYNNNNNNNNNNNTLFLKKFI
jgi:hypothetical protein